MPFWLRAIVLYCLVGFGLVLVVGLDWRLGLDLLVLGAGLLPAVLRNSPRSWLFLKRIQYWITNANTSWHVSLSFSGSFEEGQLRKFVRKLAEAEKDSVRILEDNGTRLLFHYQRLFVVELALRPSLDEAALDTARSSQYGVLSFALLDQHVGYRRSKDVLEKVLIPLVERLKEALPSSSGRYAMRVAFEGLNPFLGLYLQQLRTADVRDFGLEVAPKGASADEYFRVTLRELVVHSGSLDSFRRNALNGLAFGAMGT